MVTESDSKIMTTLDKIIINNLYKFARPLAHWRGRSLVRLVCLICLICYLTLFDNWPLACRHKSPECHLRWRAGATLPTSWRSKARFSIFFGPSGGNLKMMIFGIAPKRQKSKDKSNLVNQCHLFVSKTWLSRSPLASFFHRFCEWPKIRKSVCFSILSDGFRLWETIDFQIVL